MDQSNAVSGTAAGVPFIAFPPTTMARDLAPVVIGWHLMDPPRTEAAFAAALPLDGLDAWRIYLGLPLFGSRLPADGPEEIMWLGMEDAVLNLFDPVVTGAAAEFPAALADLRVKLGISSTLIGVLGGSAGAAVAQLVMAESDIAISAAVLVSPMVQLRPTVDMIAREMGVDYRWQKASNAVANRLDFVARASEIARQQHEPPVLVIVGGADDAAFLDSASDLHARLVNIYADQDRVQLATIAGMPHALADEPGIEPAPQNADAAAVDRLAVDWFRRHLTTG